ncbi:MAG: archaemetzincin [Planctomycetota bacterium]|jgi:archaemetzincin
MRPLAALVLAAILVPSCTDSPAPPPRDPAFKRLGPPREGEWLERFPEPGQTFEAYVASDPVRADGLRSVLAFVPVGELAGSEAADVAASVEFSGLWFGLPTRTLERRDLPASGWQRVRHFPWLEGPTVQYHTDWFLRRLLPPLVPEDAVCLLAITFGDLYPDESWNFVFGMSTFRRRVAVCSFLRYGAAFEGGPETPATRTLALLRGLKVVTHEIGHAFGLRHCTVYWCNMNGSNSLEESDRQPLHLCPDCLRKLEWNRGFDVIDRYRKLLGFYETHGLSGQVSWTAGRVRSLAR